MRRVALVLLAAMLLALSAEHFLHAQPQPARVGRPNYDFATLPYLRDSEPPSRHSGEAALAYSARLNRYVFRSTYHCPYDLPGQNSILESVILPASAFPQGTLDRDRFECGQCAQRSYLLVEYLKASGIPARILGLRGHVVVLAGDYILDPDFGVGPLRYSDPDLYRSAHAAYAKAPQDGVDYAALLASKGDNFFYNMPKMDRLCGIQEMLYGLANFLAAMLAVAALALLSRVNPHRPASDIPARRVDDSNRVDI